METKLKKLLASRQELVHSELQKVVSHVQRESGEWVLNTVMIEGHDVPFKYKRKQKYQNLKGALVNLTYYTGADHVAGMEIEVMRVVRIKRA